MALYAVILAGGSGTRFWPASRRAWPKQLLGLSPGSDQSLIAAAVRRARAFCPPERILVATGAHLVEAIRRALPELGPECVLGEPVARNTAACIGWAAALIRRRDPEAVVMVLPSDQHIEDEPAFTETLERAIGAARAGPMATVGVTPTSPATGYGYIEAGECLGNGRYRVVRFVEKPDRERAEQYLATGRYYWNSGMFFFRVQEMLHAIARFLPDLYQGLELIDAAAAQGSVTERQQTVRVFESLEAISIDCGVMERLSELTVVPARFGWNDLGSWQSAWEVAAKDERGNALDEGCLALESTNTLLRNLRTEPGGRVMAVVGVENLCVVDTDDALLVIPRDRAQDVRLVVEALRQRGMHDKL